MSDAPAPQTAPEAQLIAPAGTTPYELIGDANGVASRDELVGSDGVDLLHGRLGDDRLEGGSNGDILVGGLGADRISGGDGSDAIHGGGHMPGVTRASEEPPADQSFVWLNDGPGWYAGLTTQGTLSVGGALSPVGDVVAGAELDYVVAGVAVDPVGSGAGVDQVAIVRLIGPSRCARVAVRVSRNTKVPRLYERLS